MLVGRVIQGFGGGIFPLAGLLMLPMSVTMFLSGVTTPRLSHRIGAKKMVPPHQTGVANGMNTNIRSIGGAIGAAVMASIVSAHTLPTGLPAEKGYTYGFTALGIATAGAALAAFLVPRNHQHTGEQEASAERP
jgi:sugar phosphate permease